MRTQKLSPKSEKKSKKGIKKEATPTVESPPVLILEPAPMVDENGFTIVDETPRKLVFEDRPHSSSGSWAHC